MHSSCGHHDSSNFCCPLALTRPRAVTDVSGTAVGLPTPHNEDSWLGVVPPGLVGLGRGLH